MFLGPSLPPPRSIDRKHQNFRLSLIPLPIYYLNNSINDYSENQTNKGNNTKKRTKMPPSIDRGYIISSEKISGRGRGKITLFLIPFLSHIFHELACIHSGNLCVNACCKNA